MFPQAHGNGVVYKLYSSSLVFQGEIALDLGATCVRPQVLTVLWPQPHISHLFCVMHPVVSHDMVSHGGVDLGLRGSPDTDHYDHGVITVI